MLYPDLHTHTTYSHDGKASFAEIVCEAEKKQIPAVAVTDHCDLVHTPERDCFTPIRLSVEEGKKSSTEQVKILSGVEISDAPLFFEEAQTIFSLCDYDVTLASVHHVDFNGSLLSHRLRDFKTFSKEEIDRYLERYFDLVEENITRFSFDVLAHLTLPLRYIEKRDGISLDLSVYEERIRKILSICIEKKMALECNTSGFSDGKYFMPDAEIFQIYKELGGQYVTLGSDAHKGEKVGLGFLEAAAMLKKCGFTEVYSYVKHCPQSFSL